MHIFEMSYEMLTKNVILYVCIYLENRDTTESIGKLK